MLAVGMDSATLQPRLDGIHKKISGELVIACFNNPKNNTVSGDQNMICALQSMLETEGVFVRRLRTSNAYHSPRMNGVADDYLKAMGEAPEGHRVTFDQPVRMFSTSTGIEDSLQNEFWVHNQVSTVKFAAALGSMCLSNDSSALDEIFEIGPHSALQSAIKETLSGRASVSHRRTLNRNDSSAKTPLDTVGALTVRGTKANLVEVNCSTEPAERIPKLLVDLPGYPFNHEEKGLYESRLSRNIRFREFPRHDLLGAPHPDSSLLRWSWRHFLRVNENPWLRDHVVSDVHPFVLPHGESTV
jgi:acyl transferase domain-containing protein